MLLNYLKLIHTDSTQGKVVYMSLLKPRTVAETIKSLTAPVLERLPAPPYKPDRFKPDCKAALAVASMREHMTDEGWQIMTGLEKAGYILCGSSLTINATHVPHILGRIDPTVLVVQDKREWDYKPGDFRDPSEQFSDIGSLKEIDNIFKLTVLKDAQQKPNYHREAADEMGCHAWVVYYNTRIVAHLAPYVRPEHVVRTYHSLDANKVPDYTADRIDGAVLSGAISGAYPLRKRLRNDVWMLPKVKILKHPGYHRKGCNTPAYLAELAKFKVAICTSSIYGYALRKIIEATACGCVVITDLPLDEMLPVIDANLIRINPELPTRQIAQMIKQAVADYSPERQEQFAKLAKKWYHYEAVGLRLARAIDDLKERYPREPEDN